MDLGVCPFFRIVVADGLGGGAEVAQGLEASGSASELIAKVDDGVSGAMMGELSFGEEFGGGFLDEGRSEFVGNLRF